MRVVFIISLIIVTYLSCHSCNEYSNSIDEAKSALRINYDYDFTPLKRGRKKKNRNKGHKQMMKQFPWIRLIPRILTGALLLYNDPPAKKKKSNSSEKLSGRNHPIVEAGGATGKLCLVSPGQEYCVGERLNLDQEKRRRNSRKRND